MSWQELRFVCGSEQAERISDVLEGRALAVTLTDAGNHPIYEPEPGRSPLWQQTRVSALFAASHAIDAEVAWVNQAMAGDLPAHEVVTVADEDWVGRGQRGFVARSFGKRLWVVPSWSEVPAQAQVCLRLDPGLAFGTGAHPTTAMCLEWLDARVRPGHTVLDFGCGSGVLAIAAAVLGADRVVGNDIDAQALLATRANAAHNGVEHRVQVLPADACTGGDFDRVVANILARPLTELAQRIAGVVAPGGELALSGLLERQTQSLVAAYDGRCGLRYAGRCTTGGWVRLDFVREAE